MSRPLTNESSSKYDPLSCSHWTIYPWITASVQVGWLLTILSYLMGVSGEWVCISGTLIRQVFRLAPGITKSHSPASSKTTALTDLRSVAFTVMMLRMESDQLVNLSPVS